MTGGIESRGNEVFQPVSKTGNLDAKKYDNTLSKKVKNKTKVSELLDEFDISKDKQGKLIERILKYSDNNKVFNDLLGKIKNSFDEDEVLIILNNIEKEVDNTEKEVDNTEKEVDNTEKEVDSTEINNGIIEKEKQNLFLKKINSLIPSNGKHKESYGRILDLLKLGDIKNYPEIINLLKNPGKLASIVDDLGGINSTKYIEFKNTLIEMDSSFIEKFNIIDAGLIGYKAKALLGVSKLSGTTNLGLNKLTNKTDDGFEITASRGGKRGLSLEGSEYNLGARLDNTNKIKEINIIEKEMKKEVSPINNLLNSIQSIKKYIKESIVNGVEIDDIKQNIKNTNPDLYNELQLDLITSIEQIIQGLDYLYNKTEKEKDKILKKIKQKIDEIVSKNTNEANKKDKEKKKTLKYLNQICFDLFPQSLTNQLIKEYKSNIFSIPGITLNKDTLDLENGMFGETFMEKGGDRMKDNLVMFMEKAIYGELGYKDSIFKNLNFKNGATIVPSDFMGEIKSQGILTKGNWNIIKLRENLSKEVPISKKT